MTKTSKFERFFKFTWLTYNPTNKDWDALLNLLMEKGTVTNISEYTITFNDTFTVWIENHPYASGHLYGYKGSAITNKDHFHCSKATKIKLEDFVNSYIQSQDEISTAIKNSIKEYSA